MQLKCKIYQIILATVIMGHLNTIIRLTNATNASVTIDFVKIGGCNSTLLVRIGDYCDFVVTITISPSNSSDASTDLAVEIIMPDTNSSVMQMSKPSVTYAGQNFLNSQNLYNPVITMMSQRNSSQFDDAQINFGTVTNNGLIAPNNSTENSIQITFRSVVISNPTYQTNGSQYWVTVGIEYNNVTEIWIGQALFIFSNSSNGVPGPFAIGSILNSSLQVPQGSPFTVAIPIEYNHTYASNFAFTITNNDPSRLGLCGAYIGSATPGFQHLTTLSYEIANQLTSSLINNAISINFGQIVNSNSYSGSMSTLSITIYGRVFKTDSVSSYASGTMTVQVSSSTSTTSTKTFAVNALAAVSSVSLNGSTLPSFTIQTDKVTLRIYETLKMRISMTVPIGFSAPVTIYLDGSSNTSMPVFKVCSIVFLSAGENVAGSDGRCSDTSTSQRVYSSSTNASDYDQLSYDYGVITNTGLRSATYSNTVNTIVFDTIFQLLNTTESIVSATAIMTLGSDTIWIGNSVVNVTTSIYNITNSTQPTFYLSYENNSTTNQSVTQLGYTRLIYYDIYTKPSGIYLPMILRVTTDETSLGSSIPAASICRIKVLYVGQNLPCINKELYNQDQSRFITYQSNYKPNKNDTAYVNLGPLCNYETIQTNIDYDRIRIGIYVKIEPALADGQLTYVNLDIYYSSTDLWLGQVPFIASQSLPPMNVIGTPLLFPLNSSTQSFNVNKLTVVNYGLKIPPSSSGTYTSLNTAIVNEANQKTSVCYVGMSSNRGSNVPCSNDVSSVFSYNLNGISALANTDLGVICNIESNTSTINSSMFADSDTIIIQVYILATLETSSTFDITLSNLIPYGQSALAATTTTLNTGLTSSFGIISSLNSLNAIVYQQLNDTNNRSFVFLGQDVSIRIQFVLTNNLTSELCYPIQFEFSLSAASINSAYFTNGFFISAGDNLICMRKKPSINLSQGGSTLYNASMFVDFGTACYYPIDPTNITASTLTVQVNMRVPVTTTIPVNSQINVNAIALTNNNQSSINITVPLTVQNYTTHSGFILFSNDSVNVLPATQNSTIQSQIRELVTYDFKIYIPTYAQGRLQILITSIPISNAITINIISADILSAGTNVGSFMSEYLIPNRYQWLYSTTVPGSTYQDRAYLDLGIVTNTGTSILQNTYSNTTDNFIFVRAVGYLTDSPSAEQNATFNVALIAQYGRINVSNTISNIVVRNGTEKPIMLINHVDITTGSYEIGSTYTGMISFRHDNNSNAECINAQIIVYIPTWISLNSYNSTISSTNYTTDNNSYILFNFGTILFNDFGSLTLTLNIGTSNQMAYVYQRYSSPIITIPFEFMCMKRARANVIYYPTSKVFAFNDIISLSTSIAPVSNYSSLLDQLNSCQFQTSIIGSDASLVRSTGWQTGYRSNQWMLSGSTYVQINFGNLTYIDTIQLTIPPSFASISTIQIGYSWDGTSFAIDPTIYLINGSSFYSVPLSYDLIIGYLRIYLIDVVRPNDLLTNTSGFILNITGAFNTTNVTVANVCPTTSNVLSPRTILVAPPPQTGLTYSNDIYVCDETTTRTMILCYVLYNGIISPSSIWNALNTTVANIILFVFDPIEQMQYLYGYAQNGLAMLRSNDRGLTWLVTDLTEYTEMSAQCNLTLKICTTSESYSLMNGSPGHIQLQGGLVSWTASINGIWTQPSNGILAFDWFGY